MPDVKLMGPDGVYENEFLEAAGDAAEGSYITFGGVPPDQLTGKGKEFVDKYTAKYPNNPVEGYTAYGYEAAKVVLAAIERAAAKNPADVTGAARRRPRRRQGDQGLRRRARQVVVRRRRRHEPDRHVGPDHHQAASSSSTRSSSSPAPPESGTPDRPFGDPAGRPVVHHPPPPR